MRLTTLRISNFQSFSAAPTEIDLAAMTYVLGPNGAGKTAVLEALSRLFSPVPGQRKARLSDFHIPKCKDAADVRASNPSLWIEVDIDIPEASDPDQHASVPASFAHMRMSARHAHAKTTAALPRTPPSASRASRENERPYKKEQCTQALSVTRA
ncbi:AAA family ATPase [Glutamicibacter protophormiae]|uniref:AAA family ATPase n=1 Tax=Glutamicibacter protophormiae TaxID=37930 RepID=UPI003A935966